MTSTHRTYSPVTEEFDRGSKEVGSRHGAWYITLWHKGKQWRGLGSYTTPEEAMDAYLKAKQELHTRP